MRTALLAAALVLPALADDVVVVTGSGEARLRPDRVVLSFRVDESAEKAADAVKALREKTAKVRGVLDAQAKERALAGAELADGGLEFGGTTPDEEAVFFVGGGGEEGSNEVRVGTTLTLTASIAGMKAETAEETVAAIVDAAVEAGGAFWGEAGGPGSVRFEVSDAEAARERAWDDAAADARRRAAAIAKRFGKELGDVAKLEDVTDGVPAEEGEFAWPAGVGGTPTATCAGDMVVRASVRATFRLK